MLIVSDKLATQEDLDRIFGPSGLTFGAPAMSESVKPDSSPPRDPSKELDSTDE